MANPIHRINIVAKDKRSQRKVADSTTKLDKTAGGPAGLARGRLGLRKIGFRSCKGANKTLYGCSN